MGRSFLAKYGEVVELASFWSRPENDRLMAAEARPRFSSVFRRTIFQYSY